MRFSSYPDQRVKKDANDLEMGVIGSVSMLQNASLSTQPITSFDWSPDKVSDVYLILYNSSLLLVIHVSLILAWHAVGKTGQ